MEMIMETKENKGGKLQWIMKEKSKFISNVPSVVK